MSAFGSAAVALGEAADIIAADDDSVPDGLYWRITPGGAVELPAGPVLLRHFAVDATPVGVIDTSTGQPPAAGRPVSPDAAVLLLPQSPPGALICWAHLQADGDLRVAAISGRVAVGGAFVELGARTQAPYDVAGHDIAGLVVSGAGHIIEATFYALPSDFTADTGDIPGSPQVHAPPDDVIPRHGYVVPGNAASWKERVALAAPRRSVPYALTDPNGNWSPDDELGRAEQIARAGDSVADWLHIAYDALGSGARGTIAGATGAPGQAYRVVASQAAAAALAVAALDPGIGRWLGRSGMLAHGMVKAQWHAVLVATVPLHVYTDSLPPGVTVTRVAADDFVYDDRIAGNGGFANLLQEVATWKPHPRFGAPDVLLAHIPMPYVVATTPARPVRPALDRAPAEPAVASTSAPRWAPDPPRRWEQTIAIGDRPTSAYALHGPIPRAPVALVRTDPDPASLHPVVDGTGLAAPLVPGWDDAAGMSTLSGSQPVADGAQAVPVSWSVTLSDWIGRWGDPAGIALSAPAPPAPAPPTIETGLGRSATPAGVAAASPGQVHVTFRVPPKTLPAALPLQQITWAVDGTAQPPLDLAGAAIEPGSAALLVSAQFPAPPTVPGQHRTIAVTAQVEDSAGTASDTARAELDASDTRALPAPTVAPQLLTTSRRAAEATVSVTLTVRAPGDGAYRFYLASEAALRTAAGLAAEPTASRAVRAQQLLEHAGATARQASMLALSDPAPVRNGLASARLDIPAGTIDVLAVRAVPVTAEVAPSGRVVRDGVEAPFTSVPPAFIVVPYDDVPPTPQLTLTAGAPEPTSTPVTATVTVRGVQAGVLGRYAAEPMQARIVEASTDGDPWFWPQLATAPLTQSSSDPSVFTADVTVDVPAWSRAGLAVAVRYPPEDTVVPGVGVVDQPDLTAAGPQGPRIDSPWGPLSVPAWVAVRGPEPAITATADPLSGIRIDVTGLPVLAPAAPTFRLILYGSAAGGSGMLEHLAEQAVTADAAEVIVGAGVVASHPKLVAVLVTPFGDSLAPFTLAP
jgi:hypothetical protein